MSDKKYEDIQALSYDQAVVETEQLLDELENGGIPVDQVLEKSRRVVALIGHCRGQIEKIGAEVNEILAELREESKGGTPNSKGDEA